MTTTEITYIYRVCCPATKQPVYIGKSNNPEERIRQHLSDAKHRCKTRFHKWLSKLDCKPILQIFMAVPVALWEESEVRVIAAHRKQFKLFNSAVGGNAPKPVDGVKEKVRKLKMEMNRSLRQGYVSERTKQKLRMVAVKCPELFGEYAGI